MLFWRSVLPLCHYNAIHPYAQPLLQPSDLKTVLGVGPGAMPVLGEANVPVQINSRQLVVNFLVADIPRSPLLGPSPRTS